MRLGQPASFSRKRRMCGYLRARSNLSYVLLLFPAAAMNRDEPLHCQRTLASSDSFVAQQHFFEIRDDDPT